MGDTGSPWHPTLQAWDTGMGEENTRHEAFPHRLPQQSRCTIPPLTSAQCVGAGGCGLPPLGLEGKAGFSPQRKPKELLPLGSLPSFREF